MSKIYNIDPEAGINVYNVRDAIVECFFQAHCQDAGLSDITDGGNKEYCKSVVEKGFSDVGGDFENPTKESIEKVLDYLAEFSKNFRDPEIIKEHYKEIMNLVNKL